MNEHEPTTFEGARALAGRLGRDELVTLLAGADTWHTASMPSIGLGALRFSDGPNGVRGVGGEGIRAVCTPAAIAVGATFDPAQAAAVGSLLGRETARRGAQLLLAPTVNLARHPLGGRNFESFGEDPQLTSLLAVAYVDGVQSQGVGACVKHLVANDVEHNRLTVSSEVDERTLREVYLRPFEATAAAGVWSYMAAYPKLNGRHCAHDPWLLGDVIRDDWGFDGFVVSDWGATHGPDAVSAGLDLEMPGPPEAYGDRLTAAIEAGEVSEDDLRDRAARIIQFAARTGRLTDERLEPERTVDDEADRATARAVAADGMVLVRNRDDVLPLRADELSRVALIGPNADPGRIQGGGSAQLAALHHRSPLDGLRDALPGVQVDHHRGCLSHRFLPLIERDAWIPDADGSPLRLEVFAGLDLAGEPVRTRGTGRTDVLYHGPRDGVPDPWSWSQRWTGTLDPGEAGTHRFSLLSVGPSRLWVDGDLVVDNATDWTPGTAFFGKGSEEIVGPVELDGRPVEVRIEWARNDDPHLAACRVGWLPPTDTDALLVEAVDAAAAADVAVVVVGLDHEWETEGSDRVGYGLPGPQVDLIEAVADVAARTVVVVNAGGPIDPSWYAVPDAVLLAWYPGQEFGDALADVLLGRVEPGGRSPVTVPWRLVDAPTALDVPGDPGRLHYREGVHIGYRSYDARDVEVAVPFGFGLGYTSIELDGEPVLVDADADGGAVVEVGVVNEGDRAGKAVVQVYVEPPPGPWRRPIRSFGGVGVARLAAGERSTLRIAVPERVLQVWDVETGGWITPPGRYRLAAGWSSRELVAGVDLPR